MRADAGNYDGACLAVSRVIKPKANRCLSRSVIGEDPCPNP
jgi:hypothetical protein